MVTLESDVRVAERDREAEGLPRRTGGPPSPPSAPPEPRRRRGLLEAAIAIAITIAVVFGAYAAGRAVDGSDDASSAGGGNGGAADGAAAPVDDPASADGAGHSHGDAAAADAAPVDDKGLAQLENGQMTHDYGPDQPLDTATRKELARQLALTRRVADQYPTLGAAQASGRFRAGPFVPGLGTHMVGAMGFNPDGVMADDDISTPQTIIYDGVTPDAPIAGFMYYATSETEPEGWAGPNDHWHYHENVCIKPGPDGIEAPLGADRAVTVEQCTAVGGRMMEKTNWMVHVWTIPGYESNRGVFSDVNPAIACSDGTYYMVAEDEWPQYPVNICRTDAT